MTAEEYIRIDDSLGIKEVILDEEAIVEEILQKSDPDDSNEDSEIEVEKIPHSIAFEQCKLLLQYTEQQDPIKFVEEPDLLTLRSLLRRIQVKMLETKQQKKLTDFF